MLYSWLDSDCSGGRGDAWLPEKVLYSWLDRWVCRWEERYYGSYLIQMLYTWFGQLFRWRVRWLPDTDA